MKDADEPLDIIVGNERINEIITAPLFPSCPNVVLLHPPLPPPP